MKVKLYALFFFSFAVILAGKPSAEAQTLLAQNFEGTSFPPTGWTLQNASAGNNWSQNTNAFNLVYCAPTSFCSASYLMTNVNFAGINNTTTCINAAYGDYSASVPAANVSGGTTVPVSVTVGPGGVSYLGIWIDHNQNGTFDSTEFTAVGSGNTSTITGSVFIPSGALGGNTRIRFRIRTGIPLTSTDACLNYSYGETEDYSVNINPAQISMVHTPFSDTFYNHTLTLSTIIKQIDVGINTSPALSPRVWAISSGAATWKSFPGTLVSGTANNGNWQFTVNHDSLGVRSNGCDSILYYFVAQDLNNNIGYLPEPGAVHTSVLNQVTPAPVPFGYRLKPRLKDTIFVSQADCRYNSLSSENGLFEQINTRTLEGNLTVIIEGVIYERGIHELKGISLNGYSLTIRPDGNGISSLYSLVDIPVSYGNIAAIKLNGVSNVTFDGSYNGSGKFLEFVNLSALYGSPDTINCIRLFNSCNGVVIKNISFQQDRSGVNNGDASILLAQGINNNISIIDNKFSNVTTAAMPIQHISSLFGNNTATIQGNEFNNFLESGIRIFNRSDNWLIDSNHFYRTAVPPDYSYNWSAVHVMGGGHIISNNFIGGQAPFCAGPALRFVDNPGGLITGIRVQDSSGVLPVLVSGNTVDNFYGTNTLSSPASLFTGIYNLNNPCLIRDNLIGNPQSIAPTISFFTDAMQGITSLGNKNVEISGNKICGLSTVGNATGFSNGTTMFGIYRANTFDGAVIFNSTCQVRKNEIFNFLNIRNPAGYSQYEDMGQTAGMSVRGGLQNIIEQNEIHNITVNDNLMSGIIYENGAGALSSAIQRNRIYDLASTNIGVVIGIGVNRDTAGADIINNQISLNNRNLSNLVSLRGIFENYTSGITPRSRILYNSIYVGGTSAAGSTAPSTAYYSRYLPVKSIYNNIFYNERTGGTGGHFAYSFTGTLAEQFNFIKAGNNLFVIPDTAFFARTSETTYRGWRSWKSFTLNDSSSFLTLPVNIPSAQFFQATNNGNLNLVTSDDICWYANGKALPVSDVTADFDSTIIRSNTVLSGSSDIGADEFETNTLPPLLTVYGRHQPGGADTLLCNERIIAIITWGNTGTLPTLGDCRWYSGEWPNDPTNNGMSINARYLNAYWLIPATGGSGYTYDITLFYDSAMLGKIVSVPDMIINKKQTGVPGTWNTVTPSVVNLNAQTITGANLNSFSEFTATDFLAPIPLTLLVFNGHETGSDISLNWKVDHTSEISYYEVQRSFDGINFHFIGKVFGSGRTDYNFTDKNISLKAKSSIYYRLNIYSFSGSSVYSSILHFKNGLDIMTISSVYPNPFTKKLSLEIISPDRKNVIIRILDKSGRVVFRNSVTVFIGNNLIDINNCEQLQKGSYILEIITADKTYGHNILKI